MIAFKPIQVVARGKGDEVELQKCAEPIGKGLASKGHGSIAPDGYFKILWRLPRHLFDHMVWRTKLKRALLMVFNVVAQTAHFLFTRQEFSQFTVIVSNQSCEVHDGLVGKPNLVVKADSKTWIAFLRKERNIVLAILTRKIRVKGDIRLLLKFARCFPT